MKCPHCSSEWNAAPKVSATIKNCPFCRKTLFTKEQKSAVTLGDVLSQISEYGIENLSDGKRMIGFFTDLAPNLTREFRMLRYFVEADCHSTLFNVRNAGPADQRLSMERAVRKMVDEFIIAEDAARLVCEAYWAAVTGSPMYNKTPKPDPRENTPQIDPNNPLFRSLQSAQDGDMTAQYELAKAFYYGKAIEQDYQQAVYWFTKAAKQKHGEAMNYLGQCYSKGKGVAQDYEKAVYWYDRATIYNSSSALYNLGQCYLIGKGVPQSTVQAAQYFYEADMMGFFAADYAFAEIYYKGEGIRQDYELAVKWYRKSAEKGNPYAKNRLGECYLYGRGVDQDHERAVQHFGEVANFVPIAAYNLGYCYENGLGVPKNLATAIVWYTKAANGKDTDTESMANHRLGVLKAR